MGLYRRTDSRFWWMSYTWKGEQHFESTKCRSKALANKILSKREGEMAMQMFKVGQQGERMSFKELCREFESAHVPTLAARTQTNVIDFLGNMRKFFGDCSLADVDAKLVTDYRNHRKAQPSKNNPTRKVKGATVNRELTYLRCMFSFAMERKYISENPANNVKPLDERRERPAKRMLTLEDEQRILENAPPYLRVAIVLLAQTGVRTYSEGFSLRWDQIDLENKVIFLGGDTKTEGSSEPIPLTGLANDVLLSWKKEQGGKSPFLFPSPVKPDQPITTVKTAWKTTLKNAKVAHFPIYQLRHVFCTRLSWVAPDAVVQRAMRHSSPETKRHYQLGMVEQVRQNLEKANEKVYGKGKVLRFHDAQPVVETEEEIAARN
jgi:integrase